MVILAVPNLVANISIREVLCQQQLVDIAPTDCIEDSSSALNVVDHMESNKRLPFFFMPYVFQQKYLTMLFPNSRSQYAYLIPKR